MIMDIENGRIYLPAENEEKPNERKVMHPETSSDQVLMGADGETLKEFLGPQTKISEQKPAKACLWAQITATRI